MRLAGYGNQVGAQIDLVVEFVRTADAENGKTLTEWWRFVTESVNAGLAPARPANVGNPEKMPAAPSGNDPGAAELLDQRPPLG